MEHQRFGVQTKGSNQQLLIISAPYYDVNAGDADYIQALCTLMHGVYIIPEKGEAAKKLCGIVTEAHSIDPAEDLLVNATQVRRSGIDVSQAINYSCEKLLRLIRQEGSPPENATILISLRPPDGGTLLSREQLNTLKREGYQIVVTCHEYMQYDLDPTFSKRKGGGDAEKRYIQGILEIADRVLFFNDADRVLASKEDRTGTLNTKSEVVPLCTSLTIRDSNAESHTSEEYAEEGLTHTRGVGIFGSIRDGRANEAAGQVWRNIVEMPTTQVDRFLIAGGVKSANCAKEMLDGLGISDVTVIGTQFKLALAKTCQSVLQEEHARLTATIKQLRGERDRLKSQKPVTSAITTRLQQIQEELKPLEVEAGKLKQKNDNLQKYIDSEGTQDELTLENMLEIVREKKIPFVYEYNVYEGDPRQKKVTIAFNVPEQKVNQYMQECRIMVARDSAKGVSNNASTAQAAIANRCLVVGNNGPCSPAPEHAPILVIDTTIGETVANIMQLDDEVHKKLFKKQFIRCGERIQAPIVQDILKRNLLAAEEAIVLLATHARHQWILKPALDLHMKNILQILDGSTNKEYVEAALQKMAETDSGRIELFHLAQRVASGDGLQSIESLSAASSHFKTAVDSLPLSDHHRICMPFQS